MSNFKIQFGNDVRRKSAPADLTYDGLKDIIIRTYVKPESLSPDFDYKFQLAYEDGDDFVTISDTEDLQLAFSHFKGEVLKIVVVGAKKIDVKAKAFKEAFQTGLRLLEEGAAEAAIPHFVEALRLRKEASCAYNLACAFSRLNKSSEALLWLRTALQLGYVNFAWAIRDPDLANIRDTDEFLALVRQMRANSLPPFFRQFACRPSPSQATRNPTSTPTSTSTPTPTSSPTPSRTASPLSAKAPEFVPAATEPTVAAPVATTPTPSAPLEEEAAPAPAAAATPDPKQADALAQLAAMGFIDPEANRLLLEQNGGDVVKTVHQLLFA